MTTTPLKRVEKLLAEIAGRNDTEIPREDVENILRVCRAQIEMVEKALED